MAIAGNHFQTIAFSDAYDLNDPEYATPLGICISAGMNLITESFNITLNGNRAKLFRNGTMTIMDILMMNGYTSHDLLPRAGKKLILEVNGESKIFYGTPGEVAVLKLNGKDAKISDPVKSGDIIDFIPAVYGQPAQRCLNDLLNDNPDQVATVNGKIVTPDTPLKTGDVIIITSSPAPPAKPVKPEIPADTVTEAKLPKPPVQAQASGKIEFSLNNKPIVLSKKTDGTPYYLMDLLELSGIDLENPTGDIVLRVNGYESTFLTDLKHGDRLEIYYAQNSNVN